jgi:hypothetical protein
MNLRILKYIFAAIVFLISLFVFFSTVQPSVPFWDCGEFIAAGYYLQVPHPPGTPFFLLLGRIFSMIPFAENIALRFNTISVLASAFSVLLLYLVAIKLINNYKGSAPKSFINALGTYSAAAIGALSFSFSDTFWFNAVEAEVYAFSTFLLAAVVWLMLRWFERADRKDNEKYLLMIAFLLGISTGVHLMSILAIVPVVMIIVFRKYLDDEEACKKTAYIFLVHVGIILVIALAMWGAQKAAMPPTLEEYQDYDSKFKMIILGISAFIIAAFWRKLLSRNSFYLPLIIGGIALFFIYPGIVKFLPALMTSIAGDNVIIGVFILLVIFVSLGFGIHYTTRENKRTLHLIFMSVMFILIGFTTFAMVIIRSNQNPPMNENEPDTFTELVSYLNREQYGDFPTFKRRFSSEPHQQGVFTNYSSDLDFFWRYQMNHMMTRYMLWNYAGREGWVQDDGPNIAPFNQVGNFFGKILGISFAGEVKDSLFGIPLIIGLLGIYFHFKKDWKMASAFMIMFILMGYLTAFYQNQQQPQPRERDYFYVGAFFVFSIWIAIGIRGIIDFVQNKIKNTAFQNASVIGVIAAGIILIPVVMIRANYFTHDRSKNWMPWDYSYNLLQSCAPNAVLFTNGDNDTFPLWYLQDVEGVRRDIKIANLSLLNTSWYILQLKNNDPYDVGTVRMRMSDTQIEQVRPIQWEPREITIPGPKIQNPQELTDVFEKYNLSDSSVMKSGGIKFRMDNTLSFGNIKAIRVQDIMVKEIVEANEWERPIYFAVTCSEDSKIGLSEYLRMEGMAFRLVPEKKKPGIEFINADVVSKELIENPGYSKDYKPGFKFRGLNNPEIFFDENHQRMTQNYRNAFVRLSLYYININQYNLAVQTLDNMEIKIPRKIIDMPFGLLYEVANLYYIARATDRYKEYAKEVEEIALKNFEENPGVTQSYYDPFRVLLDLYENLREYKKALELWQRIAIIYPNDSVVKTNIEKYKNLTQKSEVENDSIQKSTN